jgi:hypothetical protein
MQNFSFHDFLDFGNMDKGLWTHINMQVQSPPFLTNIINIYTNSLVLTVGVSQIVSNV